LPNEGYEMSGALTESSALAFTQEDFEQIALLVSSEFQVEESLLERGIPTYYLKQPQETKQPFLDLLRKLEERNLIATLRRSSGRIVLRVFRRPEAKSSNVLINWALLFATIATTFISGYMISPEGINPFFGGTTFTIAMLAVLGMHEMGHKITANRKGIEATFPYFIPGPPPLGTFGAVIMQKSLPPNRDALFDVGADGPISGFVVATIVSMAGLMLLIPSPPVEGASSIGVPVLWYLLSYGLQALNMMPVRPPGGVLLLHPISFAGWVGMIVTMLNLLPAGMLDGGHVVRAVIGEKFSFVFTFASILFLLVQGLYFMAIFVLFVSMYKHPGPLDDVSVLSTKRKFIAIGLIAIFILCFSSVSF